MTDEEIYGARQQARVRMRAGMHPDAAAARQRMLEADPMAAPLTHGQVAVDLGENVNNAGNARAGQTYKTYAIGNKEFHVYNNGGKREVVAVPRRPPEQLAQAVMARARGEAAPRPQRAAADPLAQLARAAAAQNGVELFPTEGSPLLDLLRRRR